MGKTNYKLLLFEIIRYLILSVFLYTTYHKVIDLNTFEESLLRSKLLTDFSEYIKYLLPFSEILIIILLFVDKYIKIGLYLSLLSLCSFTLYLIAINNFSLFYGCSCGGIFDTMSFVEHLVVNLILIFLNILGIFLYDKKNYIKQ